MATGESAACLEADGRTRTGGVAEEAVKCSASRAAQQAPECAELPRVSGLRRAERRCPAGQVQARTDQRNSHW